MTDLRTELDWPGCFSLYDPEPDNHHSALFLVMPDGLMVNISGHNGEGVDLKRGQWIVETLNAALGGGND